MHVVKNRALRGRGGGIAVDRGRVKLVRCEVRDNEALDGGGIYVGGDGRAELVDCSIAARRRGPRTPGKPPARKMLN